MHFPIFVRSQQDRGRFDVYKTLNVDGRIANIGWIANFGNIISRTLIYYNLEVYLGKIFKYTYVLPFDFF